MDFDNGQRGARFARDGDGVLELLDFGSEIESDMSTLRPGDLPDYQLKHPLDRWPVIGEERGEDGPLLDDEGNPWSNL
ncbi:hypothetical protein AWC01_12225 [Mycobacterium doricum]|uniref:Uncharacterized protein n=1 Tax=Mycolicibacterium doricum TaxID=126673 RepID=A0A1X1T713_9MYCO|nr:hypothetical protein AWC01_12225 [Mycolicibacterium doricum]